MALPRFSALRGCCRCPLESLWLLPWPAPTKWNPSNRHNWLSPALGCWATGSFSVRCGKCSRTSGCRRWTPTSLRMHSSSSQPAGGRWIPEPIGGGQPDAHQRRPRSRSWWDGEEELAVPRDIQVNAVEFRGDPRRAFFYDELVLRGCTAVPKARAEGFFITRDALLNLRTMRGASAPIICSRRWAVCGASWPTWATGMQSWR